MKAQSGYVLSMVLITIIVSTVLTATISRVVAWSIRYARAAQIRVRHEIVYASAWNQLITDCLGASTCYSDWVYDGLHWVYKTPKQWVCWFVRDGALYYRYGQFNHTQSYWNKQQTERVAANVSSVRIIPQFEQQHITQIALKLTMRGGADAYTYHTTLY